MRKKIWCSVFIVMLNLMFISCVSVETSSERENLNVKLTGSKPGEVSLLLQKDPGNFTVCHGQNNEYQLNIPSMRGGYTKFIFLKFNKRHPQDYKIVRIKRNDSIIQELSVSEIEAKEKDDKGFYTLNVDEMQNR